MNELTFSLGIGTFKFFTIRYDTIIQYLNNIVNNIFCIPATWNLLILAHSTSKSSLISSELP